MGLFFDDANSDGYDNEAIVPLYSLDLKLPEGDSQNSEEQNRELLKWGKRTYDILANREIERHQVIRQCIAAYRGTYVNPPAMSTDARLVGQRANKTEFPRIITGHVRSLVDLKVSMQVKYEPATEPYPYNQEQKDKIAAISAKKFLQHIKESNKIKLLYPTFVRRAILAGESYFRPTWDTSAGDETKKKQEIRIPKVDDTVETYEVPTRRGEIRIKLPQTENVFLFPCEDSYQCPASMEREYVNLWDLKRQYPDSADEIKPTKDLDYFDYNTLEEYTLNDHVLVLTFHYRSTEQCPGGLYFRMTPECILEELQDNPIPNAGRDCLELGNLPYVRLTDVDIDGELHGLSSVLGILGQQQLYDNLTTHFARNIAMFCHPKWVYEVGTVDFQQFKNIPGLNLAYSGTTAPRLEVTNALTQDQFLYRDSVLTNMEKTFGVFSSSRGAPPPGTRATSQLYFYNEQEAEMHIVFKRKFDACVEGLDTLLLSLAGKYYKNDKGRIAVILGRENHWVSESLDVAALEKPYVMRVKAGSSLPDTKAARLNALFELYQMNPNQETWNMLMEQIDFGQQEKLIDYARASVMAAEEENEKFQAEEEVKSPTTYQFHLDHLKVHYKLVQCLEFQNQAKSVQDEVLDHIGAHEMAALFIGLKNPLYLEQLKLLGQFPLIAIEPPVVPPQAPPGMAPGPMPPMGAGGPPPPPPGGPAASGGPAAGMMAPPQAMEGGVAEEVSYPEVNPQRVMGA